MIAKKNLKRKSHFESPRISFWNTRNGIVNDRIWRTERWSVDFWNDTVGNGKTAYDFEKNEIEKRDYHKIGMIRWRSLYLSMIISVWELSISAFLSLMATHRKKKWIVPWILYPRYSSSTQFYSNKVMKSVVMSL